MLRGAIEATSEGQVNGWIYSNILPTTGSVVLAFLDRTCIGAGRVELLREDLLRAGLGDGRLGFTIAIGDYPPAELGRITVKLESSDFILVQGQARIAAGSRVQSCPFLQSLERLEWMRSQSWLEQYQIDLARQMIQVGAYDLSLRKTRQQDEPAVLLEPAEVAQSVFSLLQLAPVQPGELEVTGLEPIIDPGFTAKLDNPVAMIWSKRPAVVLLVEGSHRDENVSGLPRFLDGAIEYACGPDRLLLVDVRSSLGLKAAVVQPKFTVFTLNAG